MFWIGAAFCDESSACPTNKERLDGNVPSESLSVSEEFKLTTAAVSLHHAKGASPDLKNASSTSFERESPFLPTVATNISCSENVISEPNLVNTITDHDVKAPTNETGITTIPESDGGAGAGCKRAADATKDQQSIYHIKWIKFKGSTMPIITQNENGPCPLLAVMNLLLLQSKIKLPSTMEMITSNQLMEYLADWIFENVPKVSTQTWLECRTLNLMWPFLYL